jgi:hypothetical protein
MGSTCYQLVRIVHDAFPSSCHCTFQTNESEIQNNTGSISNIIISFRSVFVCFRSYPETETGRSNPSMTTYKVQYYLSMLSVE